MNSTTNIGFKSGLDLIRVIAILFVVAGHFFLNSDFKSTPFEGFSMFVQGMGQTLFGINVALFMMLTGYLNLKKRVCKLYYRNGIRVILSYVVISLITILFRVYHIGEEAGIVTWIMKVTGFTAIPYAWYIEMWIGLFLLTPFLNILWANLESKRNRIILIITLFLLTAPSDFLNRYGMTLAPSYWEKACFPLLFFFAGAYIKEYQPKVKKYLLGGGNADSMFNQSFDYVAVCQRSFIHSNYGRYQWAIYGSIGDNRISYVLSSGDKTGVGKIDVKKSVSSIA